MKRITLLAIVLLWGVSSLWAQTPKEIFNKGESYYKEGNYTEAVYWYRQAAEQGDAQAQCKLGICYKNGVGVSQDYTQAVYWYRQAAEQGNAQAQFNLGNCFNNGDGVMQDDYQAAYWYYEATKQGHGNAQKKLEKAAGQGNVDAQNYLGNCYYKGEGVSQNFDEAVYWFRRAAGQDDISAQYNLAICYYSGKGVTQDYTEALKWYRKAAAQEYIRDMGESTRGMVVDTALLAKKEEVYYAQQEREKVEKIAVQKTEKPIEHKVEAEDEAQKKVVKSNSQSTTSINDTENDDFDKWGGYIQFMNLGFPKSPYNFSYMVHLGFNYNITRAFYIGAGIGYNSSGFSLSEYKMDTKFHFISLPIEFGFKLGNSKVAAIPYANVGFNFCVKGVTKVGIGDDAEKSDVEEAKGKVGVDAKLGLKIKLWSWAIGGAFVFPLNENQESFFGEKAYPEITFGMEF